MARARDVVGALLTDAQVGRRAFDDTILLVSELVTNAVMHARTDIDLMASCVDGIIRVEVADLNTRTPVHGHTPVDATSGRGLNLVDDLAAAWGQESHEAGKTLWFEIPAEG